MEHINREARIFRIEKKVDDWVACKQQEYSMLENALKRAKSLSKTFGLTRVTKNEEVIANFNNGRKA